MPPIVDPELRLRLSATEAHNPCVAEDMANPSWDKACSRILIARLSPLRDVEGSTAHLVLFAECRKALHEAYIDFAFFPEKKDKAILASRDLPSFYGIESGMPPAAFDLVLVSNAFTLELVNLSYLYEAGGIPSRASARASRASASRAAVPIVILGGSSAAAAGAILLPGPGPEEASDCLVDGIFFGEGEASAAPDGAANATNDAEAVGEIGAIGELALALTLPGASRAERLERASSVKGFWPALSGKPASRRILRPYPSPLLGYPILNTAGADTARLQISAGCPGFCSFCFEGWESRPYREVPVREAAEAARRLKAATGASRLEVYSFNVNAHSEVFELLFELGRVFRRVNLMSQRLDILADSPSLVEAELEADKRSFTLGIEGISERMRRYYRKGIDEGQIEEAMGALALPAVRELKLFYIIAGIEDEGDVSEFAAFAARAAERRRNAASGQRIIVSAGYLVRLPFTPLQYAPLCLDRDRLEAVARRLEGACAAAGIEFRLAADFEDYYVDQVLALGGRDLGPWLEGTARSGIAYDGGLSRGAAADLAAFALGARGAADGEGGALGPDFLAEKPEAWRPPLSFVDEDRGALRKSYTLASSFASNSGRTIAPEYPGPEWGPRFARLMEAKRGFATVLVRASLPLSLAGSAIEYRASWLLRRISAASEWGLAVFDAEEALFRKGGKLEGMADRFWGEAYFHLRGPDAPTMAKAARAAGLEIREAPPPCDRVEAVIEFRASEAPAAEEALKAYLAEERVDFVESRSRDEGGLRVRRLVPSARDARKKILIEAQLLGGLESAFTARLALGPKASIAAWLARLDYPARRSASVRILGYGD